MSASGPRPVRPISRPREALEGIGVGLDAGRPLVGRVLVGPDAGDRGQVVGRHRCQRLGGVVLGRAVLEPGQPVGEQPPGRQHLAHLGLDGAQVLADHDGARPARSRWPGRRAARRRGSGRRRRRPARRRAGSRTVGTGPSRGRCAARRRGPSRPATGAASGPYPASRRPWGVNGGRPQSCPDRLNSSGGAPMRTPAASRSCSIHASAPSGSTPTARSIRSGRGSSARRNCSTSRNCTHAQNVTRSACAAANAATPARRGWRCSSGQECQPAAMVLGQGAEPGVRLEVVAHLVAPPLESQIGTTAVPQGLERPALERPHGVALDEHAVVQAPPGLRQLRDRRRAGRPGDRPRSAARAGSTSGGWTGSRGSARPGRGGAVRAGG